jgi:hypothetical protein
MPVWLEIIVGGVLGLVIVGGVLWFTFGRMIGRRLDGGLDLHRDADYYIRHEIGHHSSDYGCDGDHSE